MSRKQKMKVYHGIPKSNIDSYTVFYEDFDGRVESGLEFPNLEFKPTSTGNGLRFDSNNVLRTPIELENPDVITFEYFYTYLNTLDNVAICPVSLIDENGNNVLRITLTKSSGKSLIYITASSPTTSVVDRALNMEIPYNKDVHYRLVYNYPYIDFYVNGKLYLKHWQLSDRIRVPKYILFGRGIHPSTSYRSIGLLSDFHLSNVDRGSYFPNLPQDFIDGKAIIRPKFGQQQIKGDPMYSQVTLDKVKIGTNANEPQIICSRTSGNWTNGDTIKVKGLNSEVVSGVIDSDTALCKVLNALDTNLLVVDNISKLNVGDIIRSYNIKTGESGSAFSIQSIDPSNNSVRIDGGSWTSGSISSGYSIMIETTASSSSPIVKTADGTTVVGTWSGLGTNEPTFTLGANSSIAGKDLYIEYALTMPYGNSDFPELPYSIEKAWGENGVEMKPVTEIVITDDFKGKISGSTKECSHVAKYVAYPTLRLPSEFVYEYPQDHYTYMKSLDGTAGHVTNRENTNIPQQLFSFNLIEMVERKLGCEIPSRNKVQWLKDNYDSIEVEYTGYGTNPTGNLVKITIFDHSNNSWLKEWLSITTSSPSTKKGAFRGIVNANRIIPNGVLHVLAFTDSTDGVTYSTVSTDYICVNVKLKTDSTFTTLYCENTRAREDKCNPILIQKETKTVKRYLPSKECFTTECTFAPIPSANILRPLANKLTSRGRYFLTSKGTGGTSIKTSGEEYLGQLLYKNLLYKYSGDKLIEIPVEKLIAKSSNNDYYNFYTMFELLGRPDTFQALLNSKGDVGYVSSHGASRTLSSHLDLLSSSDDIRNYYALGLNLVEYLGEIYLVVINSPGDLLSTMSSNSYADMYKLPNRPLIK